jgi:hypothetical protein
VVEGEGEEGRLSGAWVLGLVGGVVVVAAVVGAGVVGERVLVAVVVAEKVGARWLPEGGRWHGSNRQS